jgi:adenylosuccinate lyase
MSHGIDHSRFASPFTWRYGSDEMRVIWSEVHKRQLWRRLWVALAEAQSVAGIVTPGQVAELVAHVHDVDIARAEAIEAEIQHDLMAEVRTYAEQCPTGGGIIHLGATSADIEDNADVLRIRESLVLVVSRLERVLRQFASQIDQFADLSAIAFTHIQPAEPTTVGYRFALYAQDLLDDRTSLRLLIEGLRGKGLKGAVGTRASYDEVLRGTSMSPQRLEDHVMSSVGLRPYAITGQVYPRRQDYTVLCALAGVAATLAKFAFDLRLLQSPVIGEWHEGFGRHQVGSSAMPFKRNPIQSEKISSLSRLVAAMVQPAWENAANSLLERTLDDSANRRETLPVAFLACDEMLVVVSRILDRITVNEVRVGHNLQQYGVFSATERVLMAAVRAGADRQVVHEHLRDLSMQAWAAMSAGQDNPLPDLVMSSGFLDPFVPRADRPALMQAGGHTGDAPERARELANRIRQELSQ